MRTPCVTCSLFVVLRSSLVCRRRLALALQLCPWYGSAGEYLSTPLCFDFCHVPSRIVQSYHAKSLTCGLAAAALSDIVLASKHIVLTNDTSCLLPPLARPAQHHLSASPSPPTPLCVSYQAYAAARFAESCMRGLDGDPDVYECTYVQSEVSPPSLAARAAAGHPRVGCDRTEESTMGSHSGFDT